MIPALRSRTSDVIGYLQLINMLCQLIAGDERENLDLITREARQVAIVSALPQRTSTLVPSIEFPTLLFSEEFRDARNISLSTFSSGISC
jgi:hypothetical protein